MINEIIHQASHEKELGRVEKYNEKISNLSNEYNKKLQAISVKTARNEARIELLNVIARNSYDFEKMKGEVEGKIAEYKKEIFIIEESLNPVLDQIIELNNRLDKEVHYYEKLNSEFEKDCEKLEQVKNIIGDVDDSEKVYLRYNVGVEKINNFLQKIEEVEEIILDLEKRILLLKEDSSKNLKRHIILRGELKELIDKQKIMEEKGKFLIYSKSIDDVNRKNISEGEEQKKVEVLETQDS